MQNIFLNKSRWFFVFSIVENNSEMQAFLHYYHDTEFDGVAITNDVCVHYFNLANSSRKRLGISKDRIFMYSAVFYFHKPSALRDPFNKELMKYREAGLKRYWEKQQFDDRKSKFNRKNPTKLQIDSISTIFQICGIMYSISLVVFMLEITSLKYMCIKSILDYLTY